jgi:hypothetical protein
METSSHGSPQYSKASLQSPNLFPDQRLTLFAVTPGLREDITYFVWDDERPEPQVWLYAGMSTHEFANLEQFFQ